MRIFYQYPVKPKNLNLATAMSEDINAKERETNKIQVKERKGIEPQRAKHPTQFRAIIALIGEEEQNGKQKRTKRNKQRADPQLNYSG